MVCPNVNPPNQATELVLIKYEMIGAVIQIGITKYYWLDTLIGVDGTFQEEGLIMAKQLLLRRDEKYWKKLV